MRNTRDVVRELLEQALRELDLPLHSLTAVARKAIRIARLRGDYEALLWLQHEMESLEDTRARVRIHNELAPHFSEATMKFLWQKATEDSLSARKAAIIDARGNLKPEGYVTSLSIPELEEQVRNHLADTLRNPPLDRRASELNHDQMRKVLARLEQRVYNYLSGVERQIVFGDVRGDAFERNREYLEDRLSTIAPEVLEQLRTALRRVDENTPESFSHALTSCRRALKSIADRVYPPRRDPVVGRDGETRVLTEEKFVARLWQFIGEKAPHKASRELLQDELDALGRRVDRLNELSSKGVHADVDEFEVHQCVMGTYAVIGAIVRLHAGESAALAKPPE